MIYLILQHKDMKQECIPVGCVPPAPYRSAGGGCLCPGGSLSGGLCPGRGLCPGVLCPGGLCPGDLCPGGLCP